MSSSGEFSSRDLYGLQCCLRDFDLLMERWKLEPSDLAVRYSVIKAFELTYEVALKTLTKYLMERSIRASEVAGLDFQDVIRLADQEGIMQSGWPKWKFYRQNRNRTAHMYRAETAAAVTAMLPDFLADAHALLLNLSGRIEHHD
jgi:nucleotidyltransferase substrate binding protein (TIGR01987 family)